MLNECKSCKYLFNCINTYNDKYIRSKNLLFKNINGRCLIIEKTKLPTDIV